MSDVRGPLGHVVKIRRKSSSSKNKFITTSLIILLILCFLSYDVLIHHDDLLFAYDSIVIRVLYSDRYIIK